MEECNRIIIIGRLSSNPERLNDGSCKLQIVETRANGTAEGKIQHFNVYSHGKQAETILKRLKAGVLCHVEGYFNKDHVHLKRIVFVNHNKFDRIV